MTVDRLQTQLRDEVFHYAADGKKAAGRAMGTLVEIIKYYKLTSWGFRRNTLIERKIDEFGDSSITHNVEFSLHKALSHKSIELDPKGKSLTANKIAKEGKFDVTRPQERLLSIDGKVKNAAVLTETDNEVIVANLADYTDKKAEIELTWLRSQPIAIFECKRVGVEEGMKKGPQSIEKAKQGAYVAKTVSALQKIYDSNGKIYGFLSLERGNPVIKDYDQLFDDILSGNQALPAGFRLTVGVTSNHGNWFTSDNPNKELRVLANAYDWLLF